MKSLIAALALILTAGLSPAQTKTVNLEWDPSPAAEAVTGYNVWQKVTTPATAPAPPVITWKLVGQSTVPKFAVLNAPAGTTTYAVTAFSPGGESGKSNEVSDTYIRPPSKLRVVTVTVTR